MDILKHDPLSCLSSVSQASCCDFFLSLSHGNINESSVRHKLVVLSSNSLNFWSWINTREQNEEDWSRWRSFLVSGKDVEGWSFNVLNSQVVGYEFSKGTRESVWSDGSEQKKSVEETDVFETLWKLSNFSFFFLVPLSPLKSLVLHVGYQVIEGLDNFKSFDRWPNRFGDEFKTVGLVRWVKSDFLLDE